MYIDFSDKVHDLLTLFQCFFCYVFFFYLILMCYLKLPTHNPGTPYAVKKKFRGCFFINDFFCHCRVLYSNHNKCNLFMNILTTMTHIVFKFNILNMCSTYRAHICVDKVLREKLIKL